MTSTFLKGFTNVTTLSPNKRIRIFRSLFSAPGEFDNMSVDAYVIITEQLMIFCDTLLCPDDMRQVCLQLDEDLTQEKPILVVYSHADWDHVWGTHYLMEHFKPLIIGHALSRTRILSPEELNLLHEYQEKFAVFHPVISIPPTVTFREHLHIYGGDLTLELFSAPGHQIDQIVGWIPELRLLLGFDALEHPFSGIGSPALVPAMFHSLEQFQALQPTHILCSHSNISSPLLIEQNLSYLREIESRCKALLARNTVRMDEMTNPDQSIGYPYSEVVKMVQEPIDHAYYEYIHKENIRCILHWLLDNLF